MRKLDLLRGVLYASPPWLLSIVSIPAGGALSDAFVRKLGAAWGRRIAPMAGLLGGAAFLFAGARTLDARVASSCRLSANSCGSGSRRGPRRFSGDAGSPYRPGRHGGWLAPVRPTFRVPP